MIHGRGLAPATAAALVLVIVGWLYLLPVRKDLPDAELAPHARNGQPTAKRPVGEGRREKLVIPPDGGGKRKRWRQPPDLGFADYLEQLVRLATAAATAKQANNEDGVADLDTKGRKLLEQMLRRLQAPEESALHALTGLLPEDSSLAGRIRWSICLQLVRMGLELRYQRFRQGDRRDPLDHLLLCVLACIPQDQCLARDLAALLRHQPYLDLRQESAVLDLVALSPEQPFLIPIATELLLTLWTNLEASGARSSSDLASLALLFKADVNPSRRLAALQHLLCADGGRYKELVLRDGIDRRDPQVLGELALAISRRLPPKEAVDDLLRISQVSSRGLTPALLNLGMRDASVLRDAYERQLADQAHADFRGHLVTGAGFQEGPAGLELALDALRMDPDPNVCCRALMVITSRADPVLAEARLMSLLDRSQISNSAAHLGTVVLALQNLATRNCPNTLRRVADRLLATGRLRPGDERRLRRLLREVPGDR